MIDAAHDGRLEEAQAIDESLVPLYRALTVTTNPIPVKAGLNLLGHDVGGLRLPMVEATIEQVAVVRSALERCRSPVPRDRVTMADPVRIIPLGGLGEVGKNMTVFEQDGELVLIDAG